MLRFIHLSDIHFRREVSGGPYDVDSDVRNEIMRDIKSQLREPASGILVTGDIAFAGKHEEYVAARSWLEDLCALCGCRPSDVYTVPGNHDVDRDVVESSDIIKDIHADLRLRHGNDLDKALAKAMLDAVSGPGLLAPLAAYNDFSASYACDISPTKLYWEDNIELDDGSTLRLRGLSSTVVSDRLDDKQLNRLLLGLRQVQLPREDGVEYLTLCHHPHDWLIDEESVEDCLKRARLRLFGHKHRQRLTRVDDSLVLVAGATHPDRAESQWRPTFNIIEMEVGAGTGGRRLFLRINARVWDDGYQRFKPDVDPSGKSPYEAELPLPDWTRPISISLGGSAPSQDVKHEALALEAISGSMSSKISRPDRVLVYRFLSLPYQRQQQIALQLKLIGDDERFSQEADLWRAVFIRARDSGQLASVWNAVETAIGDNKYKDAKNPYDLSE